MNKKITFRRMEKSEVMQEYANKQLEKIEDFLENERDPIRIDLILEPSKHREHHRVELRVKTPNFDLYTDYEHNGTGFYDVLDRVIDTMYLQLHEKSKKMKDKKKIVGRHDEFKKQR